jgi:CHAT domain-containing protein
VDLLIGRRATLDRWRDRSPGRYRYLHFAAHAVVDDRRPDRTRIVLAGTPLDLPSVRNLSLNAELVTLSACETGLGRRVRGEGIIGLPHAFLAAGARGVVVSLWRITDRSAADFMERFYRELQLGRPPAQALVNVRRSLVEDPELSHPSRWAAFVLVGGTEGEPLAAEPPARAAG